MKTSQKNTKAMYYQHDLELGGHCGMSRPATRHPQGLQQRGLPEELVPDRHHS